ncbi:MAG: hypothetical protein KDK33_09115 [Leptospiraceae bacterium]|nr:hypothetical protein [Leptospiraceae bacterium]
MRRSNSMPAMQNRAELNDPGPGIPAWCTRLSLVFSLLIAGYSARCSVADIGCPAGDGSCDQTTLPLLFAPTTVVALAGGNGLIWVSRDGGANFSEIIPGDPATIYRSINIVDSDSIFAGGDNGGPYYIDSIGLDSGWLTPFTPPSLGTFTSTAVSDSGEYGAFSPDGVSTPTFYYKASSLESYSSATISATGQNLIFFYAGAFHATVPAAVFVYRRQADGSFQSIGSTAPAPDIRGVAVNGATALLVDFANNRVLLSTDSGSNWTPHAITGGTSCSDAAFTMGIYAILCIGSDTIHISTDGQNWSTASLAPSNFLSSVQSLTAANGFFYISGQDSGGAASVMRTADFISFENVFTRAGSTVYDRAELTTLQSLLP